MIAEALRRYAGRLRRVGREAGSLSPSLHTGLLEIGIPAVCLETRHVRAALSAQRNKTDAADALGIAHIMRTGWFRQAHIKSEGCYRIRLRWFSAGTSSASSSTWKTRSGTRSRCSASSSARSGAAAWKRPSGRRSPTIRWQPA